MTLRDELLETTEKSNGWRVRRNRTKQNTSAYRYAQKMVEKLDAEANSIRQRLGEPVIVPLYQTGT